MIAQLTACGDSHLGSSGPDDAGDSAQDVADIDVEADPSDAGEPDRRVSDAADLETDLVLLPDAEDTGANDAVGPDGGADVRPDDVAGDSVGDDAADTTGTDTPGNDAADSGGGDCPGAPEGASEDAREALELVNRLRVEAGIPCAAMIASINLAAERHCQYYAANTGACVTNPHVEVEGCDLFVAANFWQRMSSAGYRGAAVFEDMAFSANGVAAVQMWVDSVWHRTPVLSPWVRDLGYGNAPGCDTMDFGAGATSAPDLVATYPYDGQTGVPARFAGNEGPTPPAPSSGWPSGYPIHLFARGATVSQHTLTVEGSDEPIDHVFLSPNDGEWYGSFIANEHVMYSDQPLQSATTYRVHVVGTYAGGDLDRAWTFTTR
jgi:uncharacterized protein YkwD